MQETWVQSLGQEDPLEEERATHSSIPAWEIPWTEEPGGLQSRELQRVGHGLATKNNKQFFIITVLYLQSPGLMYLLQACTLKQYRAYTPTSLPLVTPFSLCFYEYSFLYSTHFFIYFSIYSYLCLFYLFPMPGIFFRSISK